MRGHSSAGRASALQAEGRRFDPDWLHQDTGPKRIEKYYKEERENKKNNSGEVGRLNVFGVYERSSLTKQKSVRRREDIKELKFFYDLPRMKYEVVV